MHLSAEKSLIVFCEIYPRLYGAQRSMLQLYERWHRQGRYGLHFVYFVPGTLSEAVQAVGIPMTRIDLGPLLGSFDKKLLRLRAWENAPLAFEMLDYTWTLRHLLKDLGADLLHCNNDRPGLMSFPAARLAKCPMVTHIRRDTSFGWRDRVIHRGTNEIVWVSNRVRREFGVTNGIKHLKGQVIYNGRVLPDRAAPSTGNDARAEFALPADARLALVLAGFDVRKDHETLIHAAADACRRDAKLYFLLAGGDYTPDQQRMAKIKDMVAEAGLTDRVLFLGHRTDVGRLMHGVDLLVNPSLEEALGGALIEAIGYGVPCVATDVGGTAEIVPHGQCGFLVPAGDHQAMADRIVEIANDEALRRTFSANGREHFDRNFTMEQCAERTAAFFDEIIERYRNR